MSSPMQAEPVIDPNASVLEPAEDEIAALAHRHWLERGCPIGSPNEDWFSAEAELKDRK